MAYNTEDLLQKANDGYEAQRNASTFQVDPRILTLKKGATYKGRFVINGKDPANSRVAYNELMFKSRVNGAVFAYGGRDPNDTKVKDDVWTKTKWDEYAKAKAEGTEKAQDAPYKLLNPKRKEMINFYLHSVKGDEEAAAKIGQVVVFRFPAQSNFDKKTGKHVPRSDILIKIEDALHGDKKEKIGDRAWKLSDKGRSFVIKVTEKDSYANYSQCEFDDAEDLKLTEAQQEEIVFQKAHNLLEFVPETLPQDELKAILDKHYFGTTASAEDEVDDLPETDDEDMIPGLGKATEGEDVLEGLNLDDL